MAKPKKYPHLGFDGNVYPYVRGNNTARIVRQVRQVTGQSPNEAEQLLSSAADVDVFAVLFYAAALQAGADPNFEALLDEINAESKITLEMRELDDPEA